MSRLCECFTGGSTCVLLLPHQRARASLPRPTCGGSETLIRPDVIAAPVGIRRLLGAFLASFFSGWIEPCFAVDKVVIVVLILHIFRLFLPRKKSLLEVGSYPWMLTAVAHRRRVGLSAPVGPQPVIWGSSGALRFPALRP